MSTIELEAEVRPTLAQLAEEQEGRHICPECQRQFRKTGHFNRHMSESHSEDRQYICKQQGCNKTFKRSSHLKRHMISHTNDKNFKCSQCIMSFGYKHHLDRHVKLIHLSQRLQCVQCNLKFIKRKSYNKHISKFHSENSTQEQLGKKNRNKKKVQEKQVPISKEEGIERQQKDLSHNSEGEDKDIKQKMLFRCSHENCLSAFYGLYEFRRHLDTIHQGQ